MRRILGVMALWLLVGVLPAQSAYIGAEVDSRTPLANGLVELNVRFVGDSGEKVIVKPYTVVPAATAADTYKALRIWAHGVVNQLNLSNVAVKTPVLQPNKNIPLLAPTAPTPPAESAWRQKVFLYDQACTKGFLGSVATACTALKTDIESTYQAGFLQQ